MREVALHTMNYIDTATKGILLPHILPIEDMREMLIHIEETLPSTMHLIITTRDPLTAVPYGIYDSSSYLSLLI